MPQFEALNCKLLGLSIDSNYSHIAWLRTIKEKIKYKGMENVEVTFPVIADLKMEVAKLYGMLQPVGRRFPCRAGRVHHGPGGQGPGRLVLSTVHGPQLPGNPSPLVAMQTADKHKVATPADWQPGDEVIVPPPGSCGVAQERMTKPAEDTHCLDWFLCLKKLPKSALKLPPIWSNPK